MTRDGSNRRKLLAEHLAEDFGPRSAIGRQGVDLFDSDPTIGMNAYYALLVKLLVGQVTARRLEATSPAKRLLDAGTVEELGSQLARLDSDRALVPLTDGLGNGPNPLAAILDAWSEPVARWLRGVAGRIAAYEADDSPESPVGDVFGRLYQELLPKRQRHALGEYYTPAWLAEHVLDQVGYRGEGRLLDPTCGAGVFLMAAIRRLRATSGRHASSVVEGNYIVGGDSVADDLPADADRRRSRLPHPQYSRLPQTETQGRATLAQRILSNVIGFDVNPLAVLAARANYLLAIGDLLTPDAAFEIPVYLRDAILDDARPGESFDYVVGNPPWIAWDNLPVEYRQATAPLWQRYGLFSLSGSEARHGGGKKDLSMLVLYTTADRYLGHGGRLGFVITQTLLQSKGAGDGFRRFRLGPSGEPLKVLRVDDLVQCKPFPGASNWTAVIVLEKGRETTYPVPYVKWTLAGPQPMWEAPKELWEASPMPKVGSQSSSASEMPPTAIQAPSATESPPTGLYAHLSQEPCTARPIDPARPRSPWLVLPEGIDGDMIQRIGPSDYRAHLGANSGGANGVYWVELLARRDDGVLVRNLSGKGKRAVEAIEYVLEPDLLYPLLRWGDVARYRAVPRAWVILAQDVHSRKGIDETVMRERYPRTLEYLARFRDVLTARAAYRRYQERAAFYSMYNVGPYTPAPIKVIWRRMDSRINAAVVEPLDDPLLGRRPVIAQETCVQLEADTLAEAHYLAAVLNSATANLLVASHSVRGGKGFGTPSMLDYLNLRRFDPDNPTHVALSEASAAAHRAAVAGEDVGPWQTKIDELAT